MGLTYDRRVTVRGLIIDWGGVLTTPLKDAIAAWITADGIDLHGYTGVMRAWFDDAYAAGGGANPIHGLEDGTLDPAEFERLLAGQLRTVAPSTSIGQAAERADAASAAALGRGVGAGLVLFGDLSAVGPDSVHLRAALFDVATGKVRQDIDLHLAINLLSSGCSAELAAQILL